jgi:hypothetical protein
MEGLAQGPDLSRAAAGFREEGRALFGVEIKAVSGPVLEAHFAHTSHFTWKL